MERQKVAAISRVVIFTVAGLAALSMGAARAEGWYAGVGYGQTKLNDASNVLLGSSFDNKDNGFKVYGGFQFHPNVAVEFGYTDLGKFTGSGSGVSDNWEATGITAAAVGSFAVTKEFSVLGKAGLTRWKVEDSFRVGALSSSPSASGTDLSFGIGAKYNFAKQFGLRFEYERFTNVGDDTTNLTGGADIDMLSFSAVFKF